MLKERGGVAGIADALRTSTADGLDAGLGASTSLGTRVRAFGANRYKQVPQKTFFGLLWANLKDPIIILLMVAAMVRLVAQLDWRPEHPCLAAVTKLGAPQVSTILGVAIKSQREESAWSEGVAIWVAVIVVSGVGVAHNLCLGCAHELHMLSWLCCCKHDASASSLLYRCGK